MNHKKTLAHFKNDKDAAYTPCDYNDMTMILNKSIGKLSIQKKREKDEKKKQRKK